VLVLALSLVGMALDTANERSALAGLRDRMESYVYLVLAAIDVDDLGDLVAGDDLGDPRLHQPGSGLYIHVHGANDHWSSPSTLGLRIPELPEMAPGESAFSAPMASLDYFAYQFGVGWQIGDGDVRQFTVSVLVDPGELGRQTAAFRRGLWGTLSAAGLILLLAQVVTVFLAFRPLQAVARDVARVESGQAPALDGRYPRELEPLARNVNRLLATEKANQQRYRNALDSLAHSLKTPLAVLRAGVEVSDGSARAAMRKAVEEMNRLVTTRLQRDAELICDDAAVLQVGDPVGYVRALTALASALDPASSYLSYFSSCESPIVQRAERVLRSDATKRLSRSGRVVTVRRPRLS